MFKSQNQPGAISVNGNFFHGVACKLLFLKEGIVNNQIIMGYDKPTQRRGPGSFHQTQFITVHNADSDNVWIFSDITPPYSTLSAHPAVRRDLPVEF